MRRSPDDIPRILRLGRGMFLLCCHATRVVCCCPRLFRTVALRNSHTQMVRGWGVSTICRHRTLLLRSGARQQRSIFFAYSVWTYLNLYVCRLLIELQIYEKRFKYSIELTSCFGDCLKTACLARNLFSIKFVRPFSICLFYCYICGRPRTYFSLVLKILK